MATRVINSDDFYRTLGERLRDLRQNGAKSYTQEELGEIIGADKQTISKWENAKATPDYITLIQLCSIFNITPNELLSIKPEQSEDLGFTWEISGDANPITKKESINQDHDRQVIQRRQLFDAIVTERQSISDLMKTPQYSHMTKDAIRNSLMTAMRSGVVRITSVESDHQKAEVLKQLYGLRLCYVAKVNPKISTTIRVEAVAYLAVEKILPTIVLEKFIGFSGGTTIGRFIDLLPPGLSSLRDKHWIALEALDATYEPEIHESANRIISRLAHSQIGSTAHTLYHIPPEDRHGSVKDKEQQAYILRSRSVMQKAHQIALAILSVGSSDYLAKPKSGYNIGTIQEIYRDISQDEPDVCVGFLLSKLIDQQGNFPGNEEQHMLSESLVYSLGVEGLQSIVKKEGLVWCLAAQPKKAEAIRAGIKAQAINALVVDSVVAQLLIDLAENDSK